MQRIGKCPRCGTIPAFIRYTTGWHFACACPPPRTWTTNNTSPVLPKEPDHG